MNARRAGPMKPFAGILRDLRRTEPWGRRLSRHAVFLVWKEAVGAAVARVARPAAVKGRRLWVEVSDSAWLQELEMGKSELLARLNAALGEGSFQEIRFRLGEGLGEAFGEAGAAGPAPGSGRALRQPAPLAGRDEAAIEDALGGLEDPELRAPAERLLRRARRAGREGALAGGEGGRMRRRMRRKAWAVAGLLVMGAAAWGCATVPEVSLAVAPQEPSPGTAESYYQFILGYRSELAGRLDEARGAYSDAVKGDPRSSFLLTRLASIYLREGKLSRAEKLARRAIAIDDASAQAHYILGGVYASRGKLAEAVKFYERLYRLKPEDRQVRLVLGTAYLELGRNEKAVGVFRAMVESNPGDVLGRFYLAEAYLRGRRLGKARAEVETLLNSHPRFTRGLLLAGRLYEMQKKFGKAEEIYRRILSFEPDNRLARQRLGRVYIRKENIQGALKEYERLSKDEPDNLEVHRTLGMLRFENRNYQEALEEFRLVLARRPKDEAVRRFVAAIYEELKQPAQSEKELLLLIRLVPTTVDGRLQLARLHARRASWERAYAVLDEAEKALPKESRFPFLRGVLLSRQKKFAQALPAFQKAARMQPKSISYRYNLATAYYELKRWDKVEVTVRAILRLAPRHANALNLLGYMYSELNKNIEEAEKLLAKALAIEPENPAFLDSMGWVYYRQGRFRDALEKIRTAATKMPDDAVVLEHLGDVFLALKNVKRALDSWKKALKTNKDNPRLIEKIRRYERGGGPALKDM